jgi:hypothetical protein
LKAPIPKRRPAAWSGAVTQCMESIRPRAILSRASMTLARPVRSAV